MDPSTLIADLQELQGATEEFRDGRGEFSDHLFHTACHNMIAEANAIIRQVRSLGHRRWEAKVWRMLGDINRWLSERFDGFRLAAQDCYMRAVMLLGMHTLHFNGPFVFSSDEEDPLLGF